MENTTVKAISEKAVKPQKVEELKKVQPRLRPRAREAVRIQSLQEYNFKRQRPEETPSETNSSTSC